MQRDLALPLRARPLAGLLALALSTAFVSRVQGQYVPVYGSPGYPDVTSTEYSDAVIPSLSGGVVNSSGVAIGLATRYDAGWYSGRRALQWGPGVSRELGNLGTDGAGTTEMGVHSINNSGVAAGYAQVYVAGVDQGTRAVRWDSSGTAHVLANPSAAFGASWAYGVNDSGAIIGWANQYDGQVNQGSRAIRWDSSGVPQELGHLGTDGSGYTNATGLAVNRSNVAMGWVDKYDGNFYLGNRGVRWGADGAAQELGNLGICSLHGDAQNYPLVINDSAVVAGYAEKYSDGRYMGYRAVRWGADGAAQELATVGTDSTGTTNSWAHGINNAGVIVGLTDVYDNGVPQASWAVRWDPAGAAELLGGLDHAAYGDGSFSVAFGINDAGWVVGDITDITGQSYAVLWDENGTAIDLNTLIDPASGWTLTSARAINDSGWIAGLGMYDPDGAGPLSAHDRAFTMQVQVPEPGAAVCVISVLGLLMCRRTSAGARSRAAVV